MVTHLGDRLFPSDPVHLWEKAALTYCQSSIFHPRLFLDLEKADEAIQEPDDFVSWKTQTWTGGEKEVLLSGEWTKGKKRFAHIVAIRKRKNLFRIAMVSPHELFLQEQRQFLWHGLQKYGVAPIPWLGTRDGLLPLPETSYCEKAIQADNAVKNFRAWCFQLALFKMYTGRWFYFDGKKKLGHYWKNIDQWLDTELISAPGEEIRTEMAAYLALLELSRIQPFKEKGITPENFLCKGKKQYLNNLKTRTRILVSI